MVNLPENPLGFFLEDAVAAILQAAGYYIETSIHESQDGTETLELDVIASGTGANGGRTLLAEVKSGGWGFPDLFKLSGWMRFLDLAEGLFFASTGSRPQVEQRVAEVRRKLGIVTASCDPYTDDAAIARLRAAGIIAGDRAIDATAVRLWRFVLALERYLTREAKTRKNAGSAAARRLIDYQTLINDKVFFVEQHPRKVLDLYRGFVQFNEVTQEIAEEISPGFADDVLRAEMDGANHAVVQDALATMYRARLGILKGAVDLIREERDLAAKIAAGEFDELPRTFRNGVTALLPHQFVALYPYFWQVFLWNWGGFIVTGREGDEYAALSVETGIPLAEIPNALQAFDLLFPTANTWFRALYGEMRVLKAFPASLRGVGVLRHMARAGAQTVAELGIGQYANEAVDRWLAAAQTMLQPAMTA